MSKIADDGAKPPPPEDPIEERRCDKCGTSLRVSAAGLAVHRAVCQGKK